MERLRPHHLQIGSFIVCFASLLLTAIHIENMPEGYRLMIVFPAFFCIGIAAGAKYILNSDYKISVIMYFVIQGIRFVVMPPVIALAGEKCGSPYISVSVSALRTACIVMIFEFVICTFFLITWSSKTISKKREYSPALTTNWAIYIPYLLLAVVVYFVFSRQGNIISFITLSAGKNVREGDLTETSLVFARQIVLIAIIVLFLSVLSACKRKYDYTHKSTYVYIAILAAIINVCVIVGERRTTQIYTAFCCTYCLSLAFPDKKKAIIRYVIGAAAAVLVFMSIYKFSYAFLYSSYLEALAASDFSIQTMARSLQAYYNGPQNVAVAIELSKTASFGPWNFIYDVLRSTVPVSFFVKDLGTLVSYSFNSYIYGGSSLSGHLLSSVGDGYICFSPVFCFIVMLFNIRLAMLCEKNMKRTGSYEMIYIWGYLLLRFAYGFSLNLPGLLNSSSIMLITGGLLFKLARTVRIGRGHSYVKESSI